MKLKGKYRSLLTCLLMRPWIGVPFCLWIMFSIAYYLWFISRLSMLETQNKAFRTTISQLNRSPNFYNVPIIPDAAATLCETIHIALICMGKCTRQFTPMMKSLLHHRQNPIHFHFIVDNTANDIVSKLFDSWNLPDVKYTCYNAQVKMSEVSWVPTSHYSGVYALMKLLFPNILPDSLKKVIAMDSDLMFMCDVAELWVMFRKMRADQFLGLVENESDWYLDTDKQWPALGRGYNTGVMLLNLEKMRATVNWTKLWNKAVMDNLERLKQTKLADQDVYNAVIKSQPNVIFNISCQYNVQMSTKTLAKHCYGEDRNNVKIVHWNSPVKYNLRVRDADYFRSIHQSYVNFDGNLLREKLHICSQTKPVTYKLNHSDICTSFRLAQTVKLRTHLYFMEYEYLNIDSFDVTLVLQLSMDRLQFLERLVKHWEGPLSVAIYLSDCEVTKLENFIRDWSDTLKARRNIGYHLVFKNEAVHYPVNYLRNVALENVNTPYVFLMDVDFVPMQGLYNHLRSAVRLINPYAQKKCLVVPAFETQRYRASVPRNKRALLSRLQGTGTGTRSGTGAGTAAGTGTGGDVQPFRAQEWPRGHRPTNYSRWASADKPYEVEWQSDYEPYLVVHRSVPKYDTRFSGFGWNKVSHSVQLVACGFRPVVLPDAFVVHTPHAPSPDITAFRANPNYRICLAILKNEFMDELKRKYNVTFDDALKQDSPCLAILKNEFMDELKRKYNVTFDDALKQDSPYIDETKKLFL